MAVPEYSLQAEPHQITGCSMEVINELGHGFHEKIYKNPLVVELGLQGISVVRQPEYPVVYKAADDDHLRLFAPICGSFIHRMPCEQLQKEEQVHALVPPDRRDSGYGLTRYDDCPRLNFSNIENHADVRFAHNRGFVTKVDAADPDRLMQLLGLPIVNPHVDP